MSYAVKDDPCNKTQCRAAWLMMSCPEVHLQRERRLFSAATASSLDVGFHLVYRTYLNSRKDTAYWSLAALFLAHMDNKHRAVLRTGNV